MSSGHIAITGASSGIGAALARELDRAGNRLTLVARRRPLLEALAAELSAPAHAIEADLCDAVAAVAWIDEAVATHGPIDVLICNAGVQYVGPALDLDDDALVRMNALNVLAPMRQASRVLPDMVARGRGALVAVASMAAITHAPYMAHYNASKAALAAWAETVRVELRDTGVHVLTVYPGPVATPMEARARAVIPPSLLADRVPTGTPEVLAAKIRRALQRRRPRLIYPSVYAASRHLRTPSQWLVDRFTPKIPGGG